MAHLLLWQQSFPNKEPPQASKSLPLISYPLLLSAELSTSIAPTLQEAHSEQQTLTIATGSRELTSISIYKSPTCSSRHTFVTLASIHTDKMEWNLSCISSITMVMSHSAQLKALRVILSQVTTSSSSTQSPTGNTVRT